MYLILIFLIILIPFGIGSMIILYFLSLQRKRDKEVLKIRLNWIIDKDKRHDKYSHEEMFDTGFFNRKSWRLPKDKDYK